MKRWKLVKETPGGWVAPGVFMLAGRHYEERWLAGKLRRRRERKDWELLKANKITFTEWQRRNEAWRYDDSGKVPW